MSFYLIVFSLFLIQCYCNAAKFCSKYKCERTNGNVIAGHFSGNIVLDRFLNDTDQDEFTTLNETNCVKACVKNDPCRTISVVPDKNSTNVTCYLSQSNIYETKPVYMKDAKIISLGTSACASSPCQQGSQCQPNYETGGYSCSAIRPDVHLSFDETVEPECKDKSSCMTVSQVNGKIVKVYDAKTPVLMTRKGLAGAKYKPQNMNYLSTPLATPRNLTVAVWFKNSGTPNVGTPNDVNIVHKFSTFHTGIHRSIDGRIDYFFGMSNKPHVYGSTMCGQQITAKVFNSWNHLAFRLTANVVELDINGKTCGALDISSYQRPDTDTLVSDVAFSDENTEVDLQFIDALSIYNDFKSVKFVKELYEREKANYFIV